MRLHWLCNHPTPYNNALFRALADCDEIDLLVHFQQLKRSSHPWRVPDNDGFSWKDFRATGGIDLDLLCSSILEKDSYFVIGGWNEPTMIGVELLRRFRGLPFAIWTDTPDSRPRPFLKELARRWWLKFLFKKANKIMVTGKPGVSVLREMGAAVEKIEVFPYWVPIPESSTIDEWKGVRTLDGGSVRFIAIGRLEPIKRFDLVILAMKEVLREKGRGVADLIIVGEGTEKSRLQDMTKTYGLGNCVEFTGWQEHTSTINFLERSHVLVHPADWEPYGVVVLEAMARGRPVISSDMTMAGVDRIKHGVSGYIFKNGDFREMAVYMKMLIEDRGQIARMGGEARRVAEQWPIERSVKIVKRVTGLGKKGNSRC